MQCDSAMLTPQKNLLTWHCEFTPPRRAKKNLPNLFNGYPNRTIRGGVRVRPISMCRGGASGSEGASLARKEIPSVQVEFSRLPLLPTAHSGAIIITSYLSCSTGWGVEHLGTSYCIPVWIFAVVRERMLVNGGKRDCKRMNGLPTSVWHWEMVLIYLNHCIILLLTERMVTHEYNLISWVLNDAKYNISHILVLKILRNVILNYVHNSNW